MANHQDVAALLESLGTSIRSDFTRNRRVMSFAEYLELVSAQPRWQLRSAAQYLVDCLDHFGSSDVTYPWGTIRRFHLFDAPWAGGEGQLFGQEAVQNQVYRILQGFVHDGRPGKVVLLHGPNGSAKSTFLRCLGRGIENYSTLEPGALYRFNWIFPTTRSTRGGIGFSGDERIVETSESFAGLADASIDARLCDELRDHPLLLIPEDKRQSILGSLATAGKIQVSDYLRFGSLSPKNRTIFEALLAGYHGDFLKVLRHIQVERFYVSQRYRTGWVTVEPQLSVDASERQVTADRSLGALPPSLQSVALYEYGGELVGANRGLIEFDDLLKRPLEAYKYLLTTVERGAVAMGSATLLLDVVFAGSSNDIHLAAFREMPDFQSFKARIELVRVPYILDVRHEQELYRRRLREAASDRHIAPHCAYVAALWAVLTRMRKPQVDRYPGAAAEAINKLTPLAKAELYAFGTLPDDLPPERAKELTPLIGDLWRESDGYPNYEGRIGASPREMEGVILAATSHGAGYVSPLVILDEIAELCKQTSLYEFLRQDVQAGGYHDHRQLIEVVRQQLFTRIDDEVRTSLGLVEESEHVRIFDRYITHITHVIRKEKVKNPSTGRSEDPDVALMKEVETTLEIGSRPDDFRQQLITTIGAWSLDHKGEKPTVTVIFPDLLKKLRDAYFERHKKVIARGITELMQLIAGHESGLSEESLAAARRARTNLFEKFGYQTESARDLVGAMARSRYRG
jgi:predicted Ser/Thr protein kinase